MLDNIVQQISRMIVWEYKELLLEGLWISIQVTIISMIMALIIGLLVAFLSINRNKFIRTFGFFYIELGRNTPILVTLLWFTYVLPPLINLRIESYWTAIIALVLQTSGYLAETFRSGIESVERGQRFASYALGMNYIKTMQRIILPQAFRKSVPDVVNNFVVLFKTSTLVSIVAVPDLMYQASRLTAQLFKPVETYSSVALAYIFIVFFLSTGARKVQRVYQKRERAEADYI
jgi:His/Glu/Gln/Arg/opine family amino acid ABC transporter permease subunit|tara:strand:- start:482 stop:1180 length:699 start_codon:yes stop_codon:yes gene_type:complete